MLTHFAGAGWDAQVLDDYKTQLEMSKGPSKWLSKTAAGYVFATLFRTAPKNLLYGRPHVIIENLGDEVYTITADRKLIKVHGVGHGAVLYEGMASVAGCAISPELGYGFRAYPFAERFLGMMNVRVYDEETVSAVSRIPRIWRGEHPLRGMHDWFTTAARMTFSRPIPLQIGGDAVGIRQTVEYRISDREIENFVDWRGFAIRRASRLEPPSKRKDVDDRCWTRASTSRCALGVRARAFSLPRHGGSRSHLSMGRVRVRLGRRARLFCLSRASSGFPASTDRRRRSSKRRSAAACFSSLGPSKRRARQASAGFGREHFSSLEARRDARREHFAAQRIPRASLAAPEEPSLAARRMLLAARQYQIVRPRLPTHSSRVAPSASRVPRSSSGGSRPSPRVCRSSAGVTRSSCGASIGLLRRACRPHSACFGMSCFGGPSAPAGSPSGRVATRFTSRGTRSGEASSGDPRTRECPTSSASGRPRGPLRPESSRRPVSAERGDALAWSRVLRSLLAGC